LLDGDGRARLLPSRGAFAAGVFALALLTTGGCATARRAREAQDLQRIPPGERTVTAEEAGLSSNTVLTLDQAVRLALSYQPAMSMAGQNLAVASNQLAEVKAGRLPVLSGSAGYRRGTANTAVAHGSHASTDNYSAGLGVDQLLYDFGRTASSVKRAAALLTTASERLRAASNDVVYATRVAFYELSQAQETLGVAEETERQYLKRLEQVRGMVEVGRRIKYDVTKAEVDLGNARLGLVGARNAVADARAGLMRRLGLAEDPGCRLADIPARDFTATYAASLETARRRQPELLALRSETLAASAGLDAAVADLYPSLSVSGEYLWSGRALPLFWNWSGAARLAWTLFSGGKTTAAIEAAAASLRSARAREADREQQLALDLRTAFTQLEGARERQGLAALIVRHARENLEVVSERYRLGQASSVELTDAQAALSQARGDEVKARFDCHGAVAAILHASGEEER
jgi:outer membrane protein TolC